MFGRGSAECLTIPTVLGGIDTIVGIRERCDKGGLLEPRRGLDTLDNRSNTRFNCGWNRVGLFLGRILGATSRRKAKGNTENPNQLEESEPILTVLPSNLHAVGKIGVGLQNVD